MRQLHVEICVINFWEKIRHCCTFPESGVIQHRLQRTTSMKELCCSFIIVNNSFQVLQHYFLPYYFSTSSAQIRAVYFISSSSTLLLLQFYNQPLTVFHQGFLCTKLYTRIRSNLACSVVSKLPKDYGHVSILSWLNKV